MNDKITAKNGIIKILSIIVVAILAIAVTVIGILLLNKDSNTENASYSIIVDDEITIYEGDTFTLVPYLVNKDGTVVESRFDYSASDKAISVNVDGVISVNSIPENDVHVSIYERNTSTTAEVNVNIVGRLTKVLGITFSDLAGNKMLVSGTQNLKLGETYIIDVVTEPRNVEIENYCLLQALNSSGTEKNVFEFAYTKTNVSMTAVGLGSGTLLLDITNDDNQSIYDTDFDFSVSMSDENLSEEILNSTNTTLLSKEELNKIEKVELSQNVSNLDGLQNLTSLKTVVFTADEVMNIENISQNYCYRIKTNLFENYLDANNWADYLKCIIPYEESADELFIVYHNAKTATGEENVVYERLENIANFPTYIFEGYTNFGWLDGTETEVSLSQVKASVKSNGIHLYAGWNPISYKVVYHIRDSEVANKEEIFYYDTEYLLKVPNEIDSSITHTGYKFAGWTRNRNSNTFSPNVQFRNGDAISNLTSEADAIIDLYDIWEPIEYTVIFSSVEGMEEIADLTAKYNTAYTLPTPSRPGYAFNYWKLNNGDILNAGIQDPNLDSELNLSSIEGAEIILTPDFTEITYTITFRLNGGQALQDLSFVDGYRKTLYYEEEYTLPYLTKEGYTRYYWLCAENGKQYKLDENNKGPKLLQEFTTACEVTFSAVWTSAEYSINYDCNGGNIAGDSYVTDTRFWDDGGSLLTPQRIGYTFVKWQDIDHEDISYVPEDAGWTSNLIKSAQEDGAEFNFKAVWQINYYDLTISTGAGTSLSVKVNDQTKLDGTYSVAYNSTITVSYSANTGYSNAECTFPGGNMPANNLTIKSSATINKHNVTIIIGSGSYMTVNIGGTSYSNNQTVKNVAYGTSISVSNYGATNGYHDGWASCDYSTMPDYDITVSSGATPDSCFTKGTMLMLGDGTSVAVENLRINDIILAFDHSTGQYVESRILYTYYGYDYVPSIELYFSNKAVLEFLNVGHGLFDATMNEYVLINANNVQEYVGHEFLYTSFIDGNFVANTVKLESYIVSSKLVERYDIVTESTLNHIANGLLACSDTLVGICNMFKFDDDFTYDIVQLQIDIETYGLYTYDEWRKYISYEDFVSFNGAYFKIAVGKGLISVDEILSLLDDLSENRA